MSMIVQGQLAQIRVLLGLNGEQIKELCDRVERASAKGYSIQTLVLAILDLTLSGRSYSKILEYLDTF
jgi:hypothetical protein